MGRQGTEADVNPIQAAWQRFVAGRATPQPVAHRVRECAGPGDALFAENVDLRRRLADSETDRERMARVIEYQAREILRLHQP